MADFNIQQFTQKVQDFIRENKIDTNHDGFINETNGELAALLSGQNTNNIEELLMTDSVALTRTPRKAHPNVDDMKKLIENYKKAKEKYKGLDDSQKEEVRNLAADEMSSRFEVLQQGINQTIESVILPLDVPYDLEFLAKFFNDKLQKLKTQISENDSKFKSYDVSYSGCYRAERPDGIHSNGGYYTIADKFKDELEAKIRETALLNKPVTIDLLEDLTKLYEEASAAVGEHTEAMLTVYAEAAEKNSTSLKDNEETEEHTPLLDGAPAMTAFSDIVNEYSTTAIRDVVNVKTNQTTRKYIENGRIIIERSGEKYNTNGVRIE